MQLKRTLLLFLLLLTISLAGCTKKYEGNPYNETMTIRFILDWGEEPPDADGVLFVVYEDPIGSSYPDGVELYDHDGNPKTSEGGGALRCAKYQTEYKDEPWWLKVSLYTELDGELISEKTWEVDCLTYWIHVDEGGEMEIQLGHPPGYPHNSYYQEQILLWGAIAFVGVAAVSTGVWFWVKKKR